MVTPSSCIWQNLSKLQNNHGRSVCHIQKSQAPSLHDSGSKPYSEKGVRSNTNGIISLSMLPPFHSDLSRHQPGNGLVRSHSDSSYSTLVASWMVSRPVVTSGDQTPGAFKSVASSSTPQLRKFHRASDIIRLQMWKLSSDFGKGGFSDEVAKEVTASVRRSSACIYHGSGQIPTVSKCLAFQEGLGHQLGMCYLYSEA